MTFKIVHSFEEIEAILRQRYDILCEELGIFDKELYPDKMESDKYDAYSIYFAAFDNDGKIAASTRLIHHSLIGYPTSNNCVLDIDLGAFDKKGLSEISRIIISKEYRGVREAKRMFEGLGRLIYFESRRLGLTHWLGSVEKPFLRLLNMCNFAYFPIGKEQLYGGYRYPCILEIKRYEKDNESLLCSAAIN